PARNGNALLVLAGGPPRRGRGTRLARGQPPRGLAARPLLDPGRRAALARGGARLATASPRRRLGCRRLAARAWRPRRHARRALALRPGARRRGRAPPAGRLVRRSHRPGAPPPRQPGPAPSLPSAASLARTAPVPRT